MIAAPTMWSFDHPVHSAHAMAAARTPTDTDRRPTVRPVGPAHQPSRAPFASNTRSIRFHGLLNSSMPAGRDGSTAAHATPHSSGERS